MHRDDPLTQVRTHARLSGRNQARRVVQAVLHALEPLIPEPAFRGLAGQLPGGTAAPGPGREDRPTGGTRTCRQFIRAIADELNIGEPDAAFYARVTFEQLNTYCRGVTPAGLAPSVPADLRPLLCARVDSRVDPHRTHLLGAAATTVSLKTAAPTRATTLPAVARPEITRTPARRLRQPS